MPGSSFGTCFRITTFGESHGDALGVIVDGVTPGIPIRKEDIQQHLDQRKPGQSAVTTQRKESDTVHILSGVFQGTSTGTPIAMVIYSKDMEPGAYDPIKDLYRPGHADFTYEKKYGIRDFRGSGRASGRETAARVAAGSIARILLEREGVSVVAYTLRAGNIACRSIDERVIEKNPLRAADLEAAAEMEKVVEKLAEKGESCGGIVECRVRGVPAGIGEPVFDKLDALLAHAVLSIGSVKGIEFGAGFGAADMTGSEHNDWMDESGFLSNNAGGIIGGISTGQDIVFRVAVKPTSSISVPQKTIDTSGEARNIRTQGRHDPCICPRIVPVVEAMACIVVVDLFKYQEALRS